MTKYVVLSVNENPQYVFYIPLVVWAWNKLGWKVIIFRTDGIDRHGHLAYCNIRNWSEGVSAHRLTGSKYRSDTVAQISRLYAAAPYGYKDDYLMTSDIDMLPLSDYWKFNPTDISVWGHDLTDYQHMPICYIGMQRSRWAEVMGITTHRYNELIERDLDSMPNASSEDGVKRWVVDQDLITERINSVQFEKKIIHRGTLPNGYPIGRVDRSAWTLEHSQFIDCHMLRDIYKNPDHLALTMKLLFKIWPEEDFSWFAEYTLAYGKLN